MDCDVPGSGRMSGRIRRGDFFRIGRYVITGARELCSVPLIVWSDLKMCVQMSAIETEKKGSKTKYQKRV